MTILRAAQRSLGRRHAVLLARIDLDRLSQRARQALEAAFDDMMVILSMEIFDVERDPRRSRKGVEPVLEELGIHLAQARGGELRLPYEEGAPGNVERDARQRLVHRRIGAAEAGNALAVAKRLRNRLADRDRAVFGGVMLIDMQIALHRRLQIDQRVARKLLE